MSLASGQEPFTARATIDTPKLPVLTRTVMALIVVLSLLLTNASGLEAQWSRTERAGDVLHVLIPAVAFSATVGLHDSEGRTQFLKSFLTTVAATGALKFVIARERPDGSDNNSFPSGHTSSAFQGASFIHFRYGLKRGLPAYVGATFVAFSRVHADKHYLGDVMAGAALGTLSSLFFTDRFDGVEVTPVAEGGRYGLRIRMDLRPSRTFPPLF
jgi:membrane-associated phospholipid phosphatase